MAIRLQVDKIEIRDHGQGEHPGERAPENPGATPIVASDVAETPVVGRDAVGNQSEAVTDRLKAAQAAKAATK